MGIFRQFPYTNFHEMNLDMILDFCKQTGITVKEFFEKIEKDFNDLREEFENFKPTIDDKIINEVDKWLDEHPEATTTVEDDSLTTAKYKDDSVTESKLSEHVRSIMKRSLTANELRGIGVSHRGYGWSNDFAYLPGVCQNTLKAFQIAIDNGYKAIETDLQKDVNGVICLFHDQTLNNITDGNGYLKNVDYTTVHLKDGAGVQTDRIMTTLEQACRWASQRGVILDVEPKRGSSYAEITVAEIMEIAEKFSTRIIINCGKSDALLDECKEYDPELWKHTGKYDSAPVTIENINEIKNRGYTNVVIYTYAHDIPDGEVEKYAYENNMLILRDAGTFSGDANKNGYGMLFSTHGRPNYEAPLVYDSGWIEIADEDLLNNYQATSPNWTFAYRRVNDTIYMKGLIKKTDFEGVTPALRRLNLYTLPWLFRPTHYVRFTAGLGDDLSKSATIEIRPNGNIIPYQNISSDITVEQLNSTYIPVFLSYSGQHLTG